VTITQTTRPARVSAATKVHPPAGSIDSLNGQNSGDAHDSPAVEGQTSPQAIVVATPRAVSPAGSNASRSQAGSDANMGFAAADNFPGGHLSHGTHNATAAGDQAPVPAIRDTAPSTASPVQDQAPPAAKDVATSSEAPLLADPFLALAADMLDDLEEVRKANENRLRQLTRGEDDYDKDGSNERGFGLDLTHPAVARAAAMVKAFLCDSKVVVKLTGGEKTPRGKNCCLEHGAEKNLVAHLRTHPLGPWIDAQLGIGPKQGARLLAALGDPYMRPEVEREDGTFEPSRPRRGPAELCAYAALGDPARKRRHGMSQAEAKALGKPEAKMRAWNIAVSMLKAGNREVYDKRKAATLGRLHDKECVRCGPSGKPAPVGTPLSDAHRHADALRIVSKWVVKELFREARRIHLEAGTEIPG
jgi:hypothetical protein